MEITEPRLGQQVWFEYCKHATSGIVQEVDGLESTVTVEIDLSSYKICEVYDVRDVEVSKEKIIKLMDEKHRAKVLQKANELMYQTKGNREQIYLNIIETLIKPLERGMFIPDYPVTIESIKFVLELVKEDKNEQKT